MDALENSLITKMSQMTTDDRETLLRRFEEVISPQKIPSDLAAFYMDLANWNLSTAISVFYDQNGDLEHMEEAFRLASLTACVTECCNLTAVSGDITYGPNEIFNCTWRIMNDGRFQWPAGTRLAFIDGDPIDYEVTEEMALNPEESALVTVKINTPMNPGNYKARFQFVTPQNIFFGESIWVLLRVQCEDEASRLSQYVNQLALVHREQHQSLIGPSVPTDPANSVQLPSLSDNDEMME